MKTKDEKVASIIVMILTLMAGFSRGTSRAIWRRGEVGMPVGRVLAMRPVSSWSGQALLALLRCQICTIETIPSSPAEKTDYIIHPAAQQSHVQAPSGQGEVHAGNLGSYRSGL